MKTVFAAKEVLEMLGWNPSRENIQLEFVCVPSLNGLHVKKIGKYVNIEYSSIPFLCRSIGIAFEHRTEDFDIAETSIFDTDGIMIDCSRGAVMKVSAVKKLICRLALMGCDTVMLYTEDTYELPDEPYFGYMRGRYSESEICEIDDYAFKFGIEIIPCIQVLGHLSKPLEWSVYSEITDVPGVLLIDSEATYSFIEKMIQFCRRNFRSKRIHIGMDETHNIGRGKYYDLHGDNNSLEIFKKHLDKVKVLCGKYDFRPMMWGDMPFRIAGTQCYTDGNMTIDAEKLSHIDLGDIDVVYWDYYNISKKRINEFIHATKIFADHVIFTGGAWSWMHFVPCITHALQSSRNAIEACRKNGIDEIILSIWGDDGTECPFASVLPVIQLFAESRFYDEVSAEHISRRFSTCTGEIYEDFLKLELPSMPLGRRDKKEDNPDKYLLYQDPLMGIFDYHVSQGFNEYYRKTAQILLECAERSADEGKIFTLIGRLCEVLALKAELGREIKTAYDKDDRQALLLIAEETIPEILRRLERFNAALQAQWMKTNKSFGYQLHDRRIGGISARLSSSAYRLKEYVSGEISHIEELEEKRIPYNNNVGRHTVYAFLPDCIDTP